MWIEDKQRFEDLAYKCGNVYLATNYIAKAARQLDSSLPVHFLESNLLSWALYGHYPPKSAVSARINNSDPDIASLEDYLCYVDDEDVCKSVRECYRKSIQSRHLVYCTNKQLNSYQLERVNIILRMIWYQFEFQED